jgi:acyl-CoA synthetase (NDP forming)
MFTAKTALPTQQRSPAERLLRPRSVLVTGVSERAGTAGERILGNLLGTGYSGQVYALGRNPAVIHGIQCVTSLDQLPDGIDLALLGVPAAATADAVRDGSAKGMGAVVCYASGFAERGEQGRLEEAELGRLARDGGIALVGPNCMGYINNVDGFSAMLAPSLPIPRPGPDTGPAAAVVAQSGSLGTYLAQSIGVRGIPISYQITTGNEVGLGAPELIEFFISDESTGVITLYLEQIRQPERFLQAVEAAAAAGKPVVLLHPGKSAKAQAAVTSHTGALAGDHAVVLTQALRAGAAVVDNVEELIDLSQILLRYPDAPAKGPAVVTVSGAICVLAEDTAEDLNLELPALTDGILPELAEVLTFTDVKNPLDIGTLPLVQPDVMKLAVQRAADDPAIGSIVVSMPSGADNYGVPWLDNSLAGAVGSTKPFLYALQSEEPPPPGLEKLVQDSGVIFFQSPVRALRAIARVTEIGRARARGRIHDVTRLDLPTLAPGPQPEWKGKQILSAAGIPIPPGGLATTIDEALGLAADIGYPVVAKAQAAQLAHKSDVGGVLLGLSDESALRSAWTALHDSIATARPGLTLDGVLIEQMAPTGGVELVVGAKRDPHWGPVLLVGSGGVLVELLHDIRLLPADLTPEAIADEILRLKAAKLLGGFRGSKPVDLVAVATVAAAVGRIMLTEPQIVEIDVNPLVAYTDQAVALDALIVTEI